MHVSFTIFPWALLANATIGLRMPPGFADNWAAVLSGSFNRSVFEAPHEGYASDPSVQQAYAELRASDFVAYDPRFFDIIGPHAKIEHVQKLAHQIHEAPCYNPSTGELFFVEWGSRPSPYGPPSSTTATRNWQYILNTHTNTLYQIETKPPTYNVHGCVIYKKMMYVVTDGYQDKKTGEGETGKLVKIDPETGKAETVLNNYYGQPFLGFNDLDVDENGNFWITDSRSAFNHGLVDFTPPTNPTLYFVNATTMRPKPVRITENNLNGIAVSASRDDAKAFTVYSAASTKDQYGDRALYAYDTAVGGILTNPRLLNNPTSYFYGGIRASNKGYIFVGAGHGVDVIDPIDGLTLGTIRVDGGVAVNLAFGEHELWVVGKGGVWHVSGIAERLAREW